MNILWVLIPLSIGVASVFLYLFLKAVHQGQFDDLDGEARRMLFSEEGGLSERGSSIIPSDEQSTRNV